MRASETEPPAEGSPEEVAWARAIKWRATLTVLPPFMLALLFAVGYRIDRTWEAANVITVVAEELAKKTGATQNDVALDQMVRHLEYQTTDGDATTQWHQTADADANIRQHIRALVRSIAARVDALSRSNPPEKFDFNRFRRDTFFAMLWDVFLMAGLLAFLILVFPGLFLITSVQTATAIVRTSPRLSNSPTLSFMEAVGHRRHRRFLSEQSIWHQFLFPRLGFALLIAYGSLFLLAPVGITASVVGNYVSNHPSAGEASLPFWMQSFGSAPPHVIGFAGFYLYALTEFLQRFVRNDLTQRMFVVLLNRGMIVLILSLVMSGIFGWNDLSRGLVFVAGVFPQTGLKAIAKITKARILERLMGESSTEFQAFPELDIWKQASLGEVGISSPHDLARADLRSLVELVGLNPYVLLRAGDRAMLLHVFGPDRSEKLARIPIYTASDLVLYVRGPGAFAERWAEKTQPYKIAADLTEAEAVQRKKLVEDVLDVEDISLQIAQLERDSNVIFLIDTKLTYGHL